MLTEQQHKIFTDCAHQLALAALHEYGAISKTSDKLFAYNTLLEPPATIRKVNNERCKRLLEKARVLWKLYEKADKAGDYVRARPYLYTSTNWDGSKRQFVCEGLLPDFTQAPKDEAAAFQAVDEYRAREAQAS